jgi:hypothetical protein
MPGDRFVQAAVQVTLTSSEWPEPVAWSMQPLCLAHVTDLSRSQKIGTDLKVFNVSASREKTTTKTRCVIRAFNELQPDPRWDFGPTNGDELVGTQRLILVARTMGKTVGKVSLTARVRRGRWRLTGTDERRALQDQFGLYVDV